MVQAALYSREACGLFNNSGARKAMDEGPHTRPDVECDQINQVRPETLGRSNHMQHGHIYFAIPTAIHRPHKARGETEGLKRFLCFIVPPVPTVCESG